MPDPFDTVLDLHAAGRLPEAEALCRRIIAADSGHSGALLILGMVRAQQGDFAVGLQLIDRSLAIAPDVALGHCFRGWALTQIGRSGDAITAYRRAIALQPDYFDAWFNSAHLLFAAGKLEEALKAFDAAIRVEPDMVDAACARAVVLSKLNRLDEALAALDAVLAVHPDLAPALNLRSDLLTELGRCDEALADSERSIALNPHQAAAHVSRGTALFALRRLAEAQAEIERALQLEPNRPAAVMMRGVFHREAGRLDAALADCNRAVALMPADTMAHVNRGATLLMMGQHEAALQALDRAAELGPRQPKVFATRAVALRHLKRYAEALADCDRALALDPAIGQLAAERFLMAAMLCDWRDRNARRDDLSRRVRAGETVSPWVVATSLDDPALQLAAARKASAPATGMAPNNPPHDRLRVAYLSPDYHEHPSAHLIVELIERHNRARIETYGIALHDGADNPIRQRIAAAFEHFVSVGAQSDADVAALMRSEEIDIAVDLSGHAGGGRPGVFLQRPAPLAVNFAGHPGTLGADWIDYILADGVVISPGADEYFSEAVVRLPASYLPTDMRYAVNPPCSRAEAGLPETGFVFCSFNSSYKITPEMFDIWMRLVDGTEGSVLWLLVEDAEARRNLRSEAAAREVEPSRLVFADRLPRADYLGRLKLADLFLDTLPCNAHTTASDALRMGVPLITVAGRGFAARVAASLLTAAGLPALIAHDLADYEALAAGLAHSPERLGALREKLAAPPFDTARLARAIEDAYEAMWRRHKAGQPPAGFAVPGA